MKSNTKKLGQALISLLEAPDADVLKFVPFAPNFKEIWALINDGAELTARNPAH